MAGTDDVARITSCGGGSGVPASLDSCHGRSHHGDRESEGTVPEMTTIPEFLTVMAMAHQTHETRHLRPIRSSGPSLRERFLARIPRRTTAALGAATSGGILPELRDYPYRSGC